MFFFLQACSSIAVTGKFESLNLTDSSVINSIDEVNDDDDTDSDLNMFSMDSVNFEDSYLNLFKSPEELVYEKLTKKQNLRGFINVVCLEEQSDSESDNSVGRYEKIETILECGSKPKIVDFVPLDDNDTKNVFDKQSVSIESIKPLSNQACSSKSIVGTTALPNSDGATSTIATPGTTSDPNITIEPTLEAEDSTIPNTNAESFKTAKTFFQRLEYNNNNNNNNINNTINTNNNNVDVVANKNPVPD